MGERKTFVFNTDWREALRDYPADVRLEVYEAIIDYIATGEYAELQPLSAMAFRFIKRELDYNKVKYEETIAKRREAGRLGGVARQANQASAKNAKQEVVNQASATDVKQGVANQADNVYDNVNVTNNVSNTHNARARKEDVMDFISEEYREVFAKWLAYKKERKETYKSKASQKECYDKLVALSGNNPAVAMEIVKQSMANNWAGLFELKQKSNNGNNTSQDRKHFGASEGISFTPRTDIEI
jgi:hypothetical protein